MGKAKRKSSQTTPESITPLLAPIQALQSLLLQFHDQGVIIAARHPNLDEERIRFWVEQFGEALDLPDLGKTISQLLQVRPSHK
jgi:hypothetical protein